MYSKSLLITLLFLIFSQLTLALDIDEACNELDEQKKALFSKDELNGYIQQLESIMSNEKPFLENNGVEVAANLINGVDLMLGANFAKYSYVTTTIGQDFPSSEPNNAGDIFNNVKVCFYFL